MNQRERLNQRVWVDGNSREIRRKIYDVERITDANGVEWLRGWMRYKHSEWIVVSDYHYYERHRDYGLGRVWLLIGASRYAI